MALALAFLMVLELVPGLLPYEEGNIVYADEAGSTGAVRPALMPTEDEKEQKSDADKTDRSLLNNLVQPFLNNTVVTPQSSDISAQSQNVKEEATPQIDDLRLTPLHYVENKDGSSLCETALSFSWSIPKTAVAGTEVSLTLPEELTQNYYIKKGQEEYPLGQIKDQSGQALFDLFFQFTEAQPQEEAFKEAQGFTSANILFRLTPYGEKAASQSETGLSGQGLIGEELNPETLARIDDQKLSAGLKYNEPVYRGFTYHDEWHDAHPADREQQKTLTFTIQSQQQKKTVSTPLVIKKSRALDEWRSRYPLSYTLQENQATLHMNLNGRLIIPETVVAATVEKNAIAASQEQKQEATKSEDGKPQSFVPRYAVISLTGIKPAQSALTLYTIQDGKARQIFPAEGADFVVSTDTGFALDVPKLQTALQKNADAQAKEKIKTIYYTLQAVKADQQPTLLQTAFYGLDPLAATSPQNGKETEPKDSILHTDYAVASLASQATEVTNALDSTYNTTINFLSAEALSIQEQERKALFTAADQETLSLPAFTEWIKNSTNARAQRAADKKAILKKVNSTERLLASPQRAPLKPGDHGSTSKRFPIEIEYATHQYVWHVSGTQWDTSFEKDKMVWDIQLDIDDLQAATLNFTQLSYSLYASKNQGLKDFKVSFASTKEGLKAPGQGQPFNSDATMALFDTTENKASLSNKRWIRVSASFDTATKTLDGKTVPQNPQNGQYTLGLRVSPDKNYIWEARQEFIEAYKKLTKIPLVITWIQGLNKTDKFNKGFNLVDARFASAVAVGDREYESRFYADKTRSITGKFVGTNSGSSQPKWEVIELLRLKDQSDSAINDAQFTKAGGSVSANGTLQSVVAYVPKKSTDVTVGGYDRYELADKTATGISDWLKTNQLPGTFLVYTFAADPGTVYEENAISINFQSKWDDEQGTTGGQKSGSIREYTPQEKNADYYALAAKVNDWSPDNPKGIYSYGGSSMQIDKTGELAFCFNKAKIFPQSQFGRLGLTQNVVTGDSILNALADPGAFERSGALTLLKKIFFYAEEMKREYQKQYGKQMNTLFYYTVVQHLIWYSSRDNYSLGEFYRDTGLIKAVHDHWFGDAHYDSRVEDSPSTTAGHYAEGKTVTKDGRTYIDVYHATYQVESNILNKMQNGNWTQDKEDSVRIRAYTHAELDKFQSLVTGDVPVPVDFAKVDQDNKGLAGATFAIYDASGNLRKTWTSQVDQNGNLVREPLYLRPGKYVLKELTVPQGRQSIGEVPFEIDFKQEFHWAKTDADFGVEVNRKVIDNEIYSLLINGQKIPYAKDGSIPLVYPNKGIGASGAAALADENMGLVVKNIPDNTAELTFTKTGLEGRVIDGAVFQLVSNDGTSSKNPTYDKRSAGTKGEFRFIGLTDTVGGYTLTEIAPPAGYEMPQPNSWQVTVTKKDPNSPDSKLQATIEGIPFSSNSTQVIPNEPKKTDLKFRKVDEKDSNKGLEGAVFELVQTKGGNYSKQATSDAGMVSNPNYVEGSSDPATKYKEIHDPAKVGFFTFTDLTIGEYTLTERSAPNGYLPNTTTTWRVVVTEQNGQLVTTVYEKKSGTETVIAPDQVLAAYLLTNKQETTSIKLRKYKGEKTPLTLFTSTELTNGKGGKPVAFKLTETNYYGNPLPGAQPRVLALKTDANGDAYFDLSDLHSGGYYVLEEINSPQNYGPAPSANPNDPNAGNLPKLVWNLKVITDANTGKLKVLVAHPDNATVIDPDNQLNGIKNFPDNSKKGRLVARKVGQSIPTSGQVQHTVGIGRAHIRLYDLETVAANQYKRKLNAGGYPIYQERLSAGGVVGGNDDERGWAVFENLDPGSYELVEHMSPAGYKKTENTWLVTVEADGSTTWRRIDGGMKYDPTTKICDLTNVINQPGGTGAQGVELQAPADSPLGQKVQNHHTEVKRDQGTEEKYTVTAKMTGNTGTNYVPKSYRYILALDRRTTPQKQEQNNALFDAKIKEFLTNLKAKAAASKDTVEIAVLNYGYRYSGDGLPLDKIPYVDPDLVMGSSMTFAPLNGATDIDAFFTTKVKPRQKKNTLLNWKQTGYESLKDNLSVNHFGRASDADHINIFVNIDNRTFSPDQTPVSEGIKGFNTAMSRLIGQGVDVWYLHMDYVAQDSNEFSFFTKYLQANHLTWQKYTMSTARFDTEPALDTFLSKIVNLIPDPPVQKPQVEKGIYTVQVKDGFLLDGTPTISPATYATGVTVAADHKSFTVNTLTLPAGKDFTITYTLKRDTNVTLGQDYHEMYTASLTPTPTEDPIAIAGAKYHPAPDTGSGTVELFNTDEDLSRIPLRVTKVDKYGRVKSQAQFRLWKDMSKKVAYENYQNYDVEYDAIAAATGEPGDYYFRELTPGEYVLEELKTPDGFQPPVDEHGQPMHWTIKVTQYKDTDGKVKLQVHLPGDGPQFTPPAGIGAIPSAKYLVAVPDDGRTPPARPDAPYQTIREAQITNYPKTADIAFQKRDAEGTNTLPGAEFTLTGWITQRGANGELLSPIPYKDANGNTTVTVKSDDNGVVFSGLPEGSYVITEVKAPDGYQLPPGTKNMWNVKVSWNKTTGELVPVWEGSGATVNGVPLGDYTKTPAGEIRISNQKARIALHLEKVKASNGDALYTSGFLLAKIDDKGKPTGEYYIEQKKTTDNTYVFTNLTAGRYRLTETVVPNGYLQPQPWYFEVVADPNTGALGFKSDLSSGHSDYQVVYANGTTASSGAEVHYGEKDKVRIKNYQPTSFEFRKVNQSTKSIVGAEFRLIKTKTAADEALGYDATTRATFKYVDGNPKNIADNNKASYTGHGYYRELKGDRYVFAFDQLSEGTYELTEIKLPNGAMKPNLNSGTGNLPTWTIVVERGEKGLVVKKTGSNITPGQTGVVIGKDNFVIPSETATYPTEIKPGALLYNRLTKTSFGFAKVSEDDPTNFVAGAEFTLQKYDKNPQMNSAAQLIGPVLHPEGYYLADGTTLSKKPIIDFRFKDLEAGWYRLTETAPPKGYLQPKKAGTDDNWWTLVHIDSDLNISMPELVQFYANGQNKGKFHPYIRFEYPEDKSGPMHIVNYLDMKLKIKKLDGNGQLINKDWPKSDNTGKSRILKLQLDPAVGNPNKVPKALADALASIDLTKQTDDGFSFDLPYPMDGKYILTEVTAPEGYIRTFNRYTLSIDRKAGKVTLKAIKNAGDKDQLYNGQDLTTKPAILWERQYNADPTSMALELRNPKAEYPDSGGIGTRLFVISGLALSLTALVGLAYRRRKRKREGGLLC